MNFEADFAEFRELVVSAGATVSGEIVAKRDAPDPKFFIGSGKVEEIRLLVLATNAAVVIFNHSLSPAQERNLEQFLQCRILDRAGLILDIFAQRARSFEGKLQVELAQLQHLATRLVRGWTHLERQKGGIGLRGPGETQLETDRRLLRQKVVYLKKRLEKVRTQREQSRRARKRSEIPTIALVGYTNAGKSTLFNTLNNANVYVADQLFATLDPTLRRLDISGLGPVNFVDTVGFLQQLPHELIEAFHATLAETREADLLMHVVDASDPLHHEKIVAVNAVLQEIGAAEVPQLMIYNKIDLLPNEETRVDYNSSNNPFRVWISAKHAKGIDNIIKVLQKILKKDFEEVEICLLPHASQVRAALFNAKTVLHETIDEHGNSHLRLRIPSYELAKIFK